MKPPRHRRTWLAEANARDLQRILADLDPYMRAEALDLQDELVAEGVFEVKLEERHFIREFMETCSDRLDKGR